jgi:hypothetical protein
MKTTNSPKGGRKPKMNKHCFAINVRLDEAEYAKLQNMVDELGQNNKSKFIRSCIFGRQINVVKTDASLYKVIEWLTKIHSQWRAIGVNYNQVVKQINTCFNQNKAAFLLKNLEKYTIELIKLSEAISKVTEKLKEKYYGSQN